MRSAKFWVVVVLLAGCFVTLHVRGDVDRVPPTPPLTLMPVTIGQWAGQDIPMSQETLDILGDGRFLNRMYTEVNAAGQSIGLAPVSLFIGYFPTQRTGQSIHSPQNCLPGSGWSFLSSGRTDVKSDDGKTYHVGDYLIGNGDMKQVVLYWYMAHGRSLANDYLAKAYMMVDAIRWNRTDGALVRVITPVAPGETVAQAQQRAMGFTAQMAPQLPRFIPE
jgi:EpsI family protein